MRRGFVAAAVAGAAGITLGLMPVSSAFASGLPQTSRCSDWRGDNWRGDGWWRHCCDSSRGSDRPGWCWDHSNWDNDNDHWNNSWHNSSWNNDRWDNDSWNDNHWNNDNRHDNDNNWHDSGWNNDNRHDSSWHN